MQISPLNVESLLPVSSRGGSSAPEKSDDFASSLRQQEQSRSSQTPAVSEPAHRPERQAGGKKTREAPPREGEPSDRSPQETASPDVTDRPDPEPAQPPGKTAFATDVNVDAPMEPVENASLPDFGEAPAPVLDMLPVAESAPNPVQPPLSPADLMAVPVPELLADSGSVEGAKLSPLIDNSANRVPVAEVDGDPVQPRVQSDPAADGAGLPVERGFAAVAAKDSTGLPAESSISATAARTDAVPATIVSTDVDGAKNTGVAPVVPSVAAVEQPVQAQSTTDVPPLPSAGIEAPQPAEPLKDSRKTTVAAAEPQPRSGIITERQGQPPATGALPLVDGKAEVESLQTSAPTAKPLVNPLVSDGAGIVTAATAERIQTQAAIPAKKPLWAKMATAGDTSDRRFAQLLGEKTFSAPIPESAPKISAPTVSAEPVAATVEGLVPDPEATLSRVGNEGPIKAFVESESAGLPRETGSLAAGQQPFGGAAPLAVGGSQTLPPASTFATPSATTGQSAPLPVAEENIYQQVASRISMVDGERHSRITMKLYPEELGQVKLEMVVEGDRVRIQLHAQSQQVHDVLEKYLPKLRDAFEQQGLKLEHVQVSSDSPQQGGKGFYQDPRQSASTTRYASRASLRDDDEGAVELPVVPLSAGRSGSINLRI